MSAQISRRRFLQSSALASTSFLLPSAKCAPSKPEQPNVLIFFADQLRADVCGCYGGTNITTPHIDRLASGGVRFANSISSTPLCTPYRGMLHTGRYPTHSGIIMNFVQANPNQRCIAHVFRDAGYATAFIGKWHLAKGHFKGTEGQWPWDRKKPVDDFVPPGPDRLGYDHWEAYNFHGDFPRAPYFKDTPEVLYMNGYETDVETAMTIEFMEKCRREGKPFFTVVAPHPPHPPFRPGHCPEGYLDKIKEDLDWAPNVPEDHPWRKDQLKARCYFAMSKNIDDNIGNIMRYLDELDLMENTIVVFTSDHGEMMGSRNRMNKMVPYAEAVNIPLIMRWPGRIPSGSVTDAVQTPLDHMTTLCGLTGLTPPETADGIDLSRAVLEGAVVTREAALMASYTSHWDYFETGTNWPEWRGVKPRQYTYARWLKDGSEELYDDSADPYQMNNLADQRNSGTVLEEMRNHLTRLLAEAHDDFLPGTEYAKWYDDKRNLVRTALGPV